MRRLRMFILALVAMCALASVGAAAALASGPTLLFLGSEGPTVLLNNKPKEEVGSTLRSEVAEIAGKKLTFETTMLQEGSGTTGIYLAKFFEVKNASSGEGCETAGAAEKGEVEVGPEGKSDPVSLVYTSLSPLTVGSVFTVTEFSVKCNNGALTVKIKGSLLASITPINKDIEKGSNTFEGGLTCKATGLPSKTKYTNAKGEAKETSLTVTVAGKSASACQLIGTVETSTILLLPSKMVEIMG